MKNMLINIIKAFISFLLACAIIIFGFIFFEEWQQLQTIAEVEDFQTVINNTEDTISKDIQTPHIIKNEDNIFSQIKDANQTDSNNGNNQDINYNITVDKYFYNQLEEESKIIYKALESNKENMKTGTYRINFGNAFNDLLNTSNGQEELGKYYQSAIEAYMYDNPEIFYLSPNKMYLNIEGTTIRNKTTYEVHINQGNQENYLTDEFSSREQIEVAQNEIEKVKEQIVSQKTGDAKKDIKMVHDYLVDNIEYDNTLSKRNIYDVYGAIIRKEAVCEGYARSFKYFMDELNIPCVLVVGKATNSEGKMENHAWNYVQVEGKWLAIDTTWDDPIIIGGGKASKDSKYKYFLIEKEEMNKNHIPNGQFTEGGKIFKYPI